MENCGLANSLGRTLFMCFYLLPLASGSSTEMFCVFLSFRSHFGICYIMNTYAFFGLGLETLNYMYYLKRD